MIIVSLVYESTKPKKYKTGRELPWCPDKTTDKGLSGPTTTVVIQLQAALIEQ